jgi:hypothetical protein
MRFRCGARLSSGHGSVALANAGLKDRRYNVRVKL